MHLRPVLLPIPVRPNPHLPPPPACSDPPPPLSPADPGTPHPPPPPPPSPPAPRLSCFVPELCRPRRRSMRPHAAAPAPAAVSCNTSLSPPVYSHPLTDALP